MEDLDGRPHVPRRVGVLKKKKVHHMGMGEPAVPVVAPRFGVLKKKKKVVEVDDSEMVAAPRFGVLKKRKVIKPARPKLVLPVDDSATESEGEGNAREPSVVPVALAKAEKRELRGKGVLKRKLIDRDTPVKTSVQTLSPPPEPHPVIEVQQPRATDKRKTMIKELAASYRNECQTYCRQLLLLQRQWKKQEIPILPQVQPEIEHSGGLSVCKKDAHKKVGAALKGKAVRVKSEAATYNSEERDDGPLPLVNGKLPLRRRVSWRANERECVRRGLMMFGLGRAEKVRSIMRTSLKVSRHGVGDIADCCWEFVRCCGVLAEPKEKEFAESRLQDAKEHGIEMGPEVTERIGEWDKIEKNASAWLKRLKLLDTLGNVVRICANKETREAAYRAIDLLKDASVPTECWTRETDLALLAGVYKNGFGNYEALHKDEQFAEAFKRALYATSQEEGKLMVHRNLLPQAGGESGGDDADQEPSSRERMEWPEANTLTRRLKRVVEHLVRVGQQVNKTPKVVETTQVARSLKWSKRDKMEFLKQLMRWGLPLASGRGKVRWQYLTDKSTNVSLKKRNDTSLEACYRDLFREMKQLLDGPDVAMEDGGEKGNAKKKKTLATKKPPVKGPGANVLEQAAFSPNASQEPVGPPIQNEKSAMRLKERLDLMDTLRQAEESLQDDEWHTLGLALHHGHDMPSWWQAGVHDNALIKGVLKHGYGFWDDIFGDDSLELSDGLGINDDTEGDIQSTKPTAKACLKRVKFIVNNLRRQLRKLKVLQPSRRKRPAPEGKEVKEPKEPKRFKYARAVEVPRDADSRPILPLVLTDRLALVDLGTIEPDRPGFHTERHIFPVGFTTLRDHASMVDPNGRTQYTCTIIDGGGPGPLFRVFPADNPELVVEKDSASGAWVVVCAAVNKIRGIDREKVCDSTLCGTWVRNMGLEVDWRVTVSGTEMFGLSHPEVCRLIQELPGAELCRNFRPELSFSRFGPQVLARPSGEESNLVLPDTSSGGGYVERALERRTKTQNVDLETDEAGSGRDEIPLANLHVKTKETAKGKAIARSPTLQHHHISYSMQIEGGEEEEEEEQEQEATDEDNNEEGESTEDDD